ncbi:hypothetical protein R5R35_008936 [Gryllus longicercus]|uniref:Uncharacterized protein n=1 Tax=Gryllus longicercus TaxID=2509291 RepID=A0AAN9VLR6_9ORTH
MEAGGRGSRAERLAAIAEAAHHLRQEAEGREPSPPPSPPPRPPPPPPPAPGRRRRGPVCPRQRQWLAAFVASLAGACGGMAVQYPVTALPLLQGEGEDAPVWAGVAPWRDALFPTGELQGAQAALVGALLPVGALLGSLPAGALVPSLGLRRPLLALSLLYLVGWAFIFLSGQGRVR